MPVLPFTRSRLDRHGVRLVFALFCVCLSATGRELAAQSIAVVDDEGACRTCTLELSRIATLGSLDDPISPSGQSFVQRDSRGRFLVSGVVPSTQILIYDARGRFVGSVGRRGDGPGEFRDIWRILLLPGDSLAVQDNGSSSIKVLDPDGRQVRSVRLPIRPIDLIPVAADGWIVAGMSYTPERIGYTLHELRADGTIARSFGERPDQTIVSSRPSAAQRFIAPASDGVWAVRPDQYEIELWRSAQVEQILDRQSDWFPDREDEGAWPHARSPWLTDLHTDESGRIWVLGVVPTSQPEPDAPPLLFPETASVYATMVEVIDPTGRLLASKRIPGRANSITSDGLIVTHRQDENGLMLLDVWQANFTMKEDTR